MDQPQIPQNPQIPQDPPIYDQPPTTGKKPLLIIGLILLSLTIITVAIYAGMKIAEKKNQSQTPSTTKNLISPTKIQNVPTAVPTTNPTANWKAYNSNILSFKYPTELTLQERQINYFVLLSDSNNPQSVVASIDARLIGNYVNYEKAISSTKAGLTGIQTQELNNGIKISGKIGPGMGQGQSIIIVLFKYQQGAIEIETTTTDPTQLQLFDQILSTFKFLSPSSSLQIPDAASETAGWKVFKSNEAGFELKYPPTWTTKSFSIDTSYPLYPVIELVGDIKPSTTKMEWPSIRIEHWLNPENLTLDKFEQKYTNSDSGLGIGLYPPTGGEWVKINNINAYRIRNGNCQPFTCDKVIILNNKKIIVLQNFLVIPEATYNQILSTFKFL